MLFRTYKPCFPLSDFIENFWLYDGYDSPHFQERILPSGTFELVFNLRDDELRIYKAAHRHRCERFSGAIVSGPYNGFFVTDNEEEACVMGVHFSPGCAFPFLGLAADELADTHIDLETIWGRGAAEIRERLSARASPMRRFRLLEKWLLCRLFRPLEHHPAVSLALEGFRLDKARGVVRRLARHAGLSDRRFIDVFRFEAGLKPKLFNRVQRFQRVLALTHQIPEPDWSQLALDHGYFDQSHLIRDFLAFSGFSPADYLRRLRDLRQQGLHVKFNHLPLAQ
jgi:AraC-like DNA-binding protein